MIPKEINNEKQKLVEVIGKWDSCKEANCTSCKLVLESISTAMDLLLEAMGRYSRKKEASINPEKIEELFTQEGNKSEKDDKEVEELKRFVSGLNGKTGNEGFVFAYDQKKDKVSVLIHEMNLSGIVKIVMDILVRINQEDR